MMRNSESRGMDRRDFLKYMGIGGAALLLGLNSDSAAAAPVVPGDPTPANEGAVSASTNKIIKPSEEVRASETSSSKRADALIKQYVGKRNTVTCGSVRVDSVKEAAVHCVASQSPVPTKN